MSIVGLALAIFVLSVLGGFAPIRLHTSISERRMRLLTTIAAGFLLGSALIVVIPEGFHVAESVGGISEVALGASLLAGFLLMLFLEGMGIGHSIHEEHHDHADSHGHGHVNHPESWTALPIGLSIHAIADGLAIGAASAGGEAAAAGLIAFAVLLHKVPAAFSLGVYASHERKSSSAALRDVVSFAVVTPISMVLADQLLSEGSIWIALILLVSAGMFLYVATVDTLPAIHSATSGRRTAFEVIFGAAVFAALFLIFDAAGLIVELG